MALTKSLKKTKAALRKCRKNARNQELDVFGRAQAMSSAARERLIASEHLQTAARAALIVEVLRTYVALGAANETARVTASIAEDTHASFEAVKLLAKLGSASPLEVTQADQQYQEASANKRTAAASVGALSRAFSLLVGYEAQPALGSTEAMARVAQRFALPEKVPSSVLLQTPEVLAAEAELRPS